MVQVAVTNLKKLENLVFMLVSALSPMAQIYFHSIGEIENRNEMNVHLVSVDFECMECILSVPLVTPLQT